MIHIRCGDDILERLAEAGLPGRFARWADPLCQGPVRGAPSEDAWLDQRSAFLAEEYGLDVEKVRQDLIEQDDHLRGAVREDEVVLWFEHDLFDQIILVYLLSRFVEIMPDPSRLMVICIGSHPDIERFTGLGQLSAEQLADLFPSRRRVTTDQFRLANKAWRAFRSETPNALLALLEEDTAALPYLDQAIRRHLADFPSLRNGLALTETYALGAVALGVERPGDVFRNVLDSEERPWQGDLMFWPWLKRLVQCSHPLLYVEGGFDWPDDHDGILHFRLSLTETGQRVMVGDADHVALNGVDRWLGGVRLDGSDPPWRWNEDTGTLHDVRNRY